MSSSLPDILDARRVLCHASCASKKRALEMVADLVASDAGGDVGELLDNLNARERLGSTGLGQGVAIPHCRLSGGTNTLAALITLETPIDFSSIDDEPVDILFALIVPEDACEEHLQLLAKLAELFSQPAFCKRLRDSADASKLYATIVESWQE